MTKYKKSAKDIAFDKERAKFRSEIRTLNQTIKEKDEEIQTLKEQISSLQDTIRSNEEHIHKMLKLANMSQDDLNLLIEKTKTDNEIQKHLLPFFEMLGKFSY